MMESISLGSTNFGKRTIDLRSAIFVSERAETQYVEKDTGTPEGPAWESKRLMTSEIIEKKRNGNVRWARLSYYYSKRLITRILESILPVVQKTPNTT
jgi:hypothetical protein